MKKVKIIIFSVLSVIAVLLPLLIATVYAVAAPSQYENTFVGALDEKIERLHSIEEPKIIIIGGSSAAFGISAKLMEEYTGMPVVNLGLYAALGTKLMLDLSRSGINEGDIVVIAPELDAQTYSLYFNNKTTLQALDGNLSLLRYVDVDNLFPLIGGIWELAASKLRYQLTDTKPDPKGVYSSKSFDSYCDLVYPRRENIMSLYFDQNQLIDPSPDYLTDEFCDYLNEYIDFVRGRGASVYFSFAPMNELGLKKGTTEDDLYSFSDTAAELINCKQISDINDYVYGAGYFYDTNFHLNDEGMKLHTIKLSQDILFATGSLEVIKAEKPEEPPLPLLSIDYEGEDDPNVKYFTLELADNGAYIVTGLTELGKSERELTLPLGYNGKKVLYVGERAFEGGSVTSLIIPYDSNIKSFFEGAFLGASTLTDMYIYYPNDDPNDETISPPPDFVGVSSSFVVHIPPESSYDSGYFWSERGLIFVKDIK